MLYLILGSNSFAGATLINHLLNQAADVVGVSRSSQPNDVLLPYANHPHKKLFRFYQHDINRDFDALIALIAKEKPNFIVDFAGQGMVAESWENPAQWYQTNIVSKIRLHDFLRQCDFLEKYVRVSTPEVYGNVDYAVNESQPFHPSTPYAVSHAAIDMSLEVFYQHYQFPVILTRFANFYGPHQQLYRIIPRTIIYAFLGKQLTLHGGGTSKRAFIYGDDVARAIDAVIARGKIGETYHFSSETPISIADLIKQVCNTMHIDFNQLVITGAERPGKDALYEMCTHKARATLDWQPAVNLTTGLEKTIAWARDYLQIIQRLPLEYMHKV